MKNRIIETIEKRFIKKGFAHIFCSVCGGYRKIIITSGNLREDGICENCNSNTRKRHIAKVLLGLIKRKIKIRGFRCLHKIPDKANIAIYNVESNGALHEGLKHIKNYVCSEYFGPPEIIGNEQNGILNIDLRNIPFKENSFDFVVTTEVFEHVPDPYKGFGEIYRVLKKGGAHIFTVPYKGSGKDEIRAIIDKDGNITHLYEPEYHGDPIRGDGILVYTIFADEMQEKLTNMGFQVSINHRRNPIIGILGDNNYVFTATKI